MKSSQSLDFRFAFFSLAVLFGVGLLGGCDEPPQIRTYRIPKAEMTEELRPTVMLGAILPADDNAWFFKLVDTPERAAEAEEEFLSIVNSFKIQESGEPSWSLPQGWSDERLQQIVYAKFTKPSSQLSLTLTPLPATTSEASQWERQVLENVNRWRKQVNLKETNWDELEPELTQLTTEPDQPAKAYYVKLEGKQGAGGSSMSAPFMNSGRSIDSVPANHPPVSQQADSQPPAQSASTAEESNRLSFQTPKEWKQLPASGFRLAAFEVNAAADQTEDSRTEGSADSGSAEEPTDEGKSQPPSATVTISTASGEIDDLLGMWLGQVGEANESATREQIIAQSVQQEVNAVKATVYTIEGTSDISILVAIIPVSETEKMFVKMTGDLKTIQSQKPTFLEFLSKLSWKS